MRRWLSLGALGIAMSFACGPTETGAPAPLPDEDGDTIADEQEGSAQEIDTDGDGLPDYRDEDSDGDAVPDVVEAGDGDTRTPPPDSDADGVPDFRDTDADGNGLPDAVD